jgi:hypothetical protein
MKQQWKEQIQSWVDPWLKHGQTDSPELEKILVLHHLRGWELWTPVPKELQQAPH